MNKDNTVYLLVGPRGAGKTSYCKRLTSSNGSLLMVCRDEILVRICGSEHMDPYTGAHLHCFKIMQRLLKRKLQTRRGVRLLLDCWTSTRLERMHIIEDLRKFGATRVVALYFITPPELVETWFWKKPGVAKMSEMRARPDEGLVFYPEWAPREEHDEFHHHARSIDSDGFDEVIRIDPQSEIITLA